MAIETLCVLGKRRPNVFSLSQMGMAFKGSFCSLVVLVSTPRIVLAFPHTPKDKLSQIPNIVNFTTFDSVKRQLSPVTRCCRITELQMQQRPEKLSNGGFILQRRVRQYILSFANRLKRFSPASDAVESYGLIKVNKRGPDPILLEKKEFASLSKEL